jgi:hypothetical protein
MLAVLSYLSDIMRELKNIKHWVAETGMEAQRRNMALMGGFQAPSPSQVVEDYMDEIDRRCEAREAAAREAAAREDTSD